MVSIEIRTFVRDEYFHKLFPRHKVEVGHVALRVQSPTFKCPKMEKLQAVD